MGSAPKTLSLHLPMGGQSARCCKCSTTVPDYADKARMYPRCFPPRQQMTVWTNNPQHLSFSCRKVWYGPVHHAAAYRIQRWYKTHRNCRSISQITQILITARDTPLYRRTSTLISELYLGSVQ